MLILAYACGSTGHSVLFACLLLFLCCGNLVKKAIKNFSRGVNKQHEAKGSVWKLHKVSESIRKHQEDTT